MRILLQLKSFLCFLLTTIADEWGTPVSSLKGEGTVECPYLIGNEKDWERLTELVNTGLHPNARAVLTCNIGSEAHPVQEALGTKKHPFEGRLKRMGYQVYTKSQTIIQYYRYEV